ncbi:hypothetical protein Pyn_23431 [Prunus yedoensis var. nudiflora]|uniref:Uncharacterized protein n=1 Tax=Prunus yedoensis var. nudiflora TaxID=2094558 RepID=A0A314XIP7_PRUYE|nr:hypothetical protein Pyn_23431 [Prunus yedoensis var. nudiflora]
MFSSDARIRFVYLSYDEAPPNQPCLQSQGLGVWGSSNMCRIDDYEIEEREGGIDEVDARAVASDLNMTLMVVWLGLPEEGARNSL